MFQQFRLNGRRIAHSSCHSPRFCRPYSSAGHCTRRKMHDEWDKKKEETKSVSCKSSATSQQEGPLSLDSDVSTDTEGQNHETPEGSLTESSADVPEANAKRRGKAPLYDSRNPNKALLADLAAARAARNAAREDAAKGNALQEALRPNSLCHRFVNVTAHEGAQQSISSSTYPIDARNVFAGKNARQYLGELPKDAWL